MGERFAGVLDVNWTVAFLVDKKDGWSLFDEYMTISVSRFVVDRDRRVWKLCINAAVEGLCDARDDDGCGMDAWVIDVHDDEDIIAGNRAEITNNG